jgi:hypothetical protein
MKARINVALSLAVIIMHAISKKEQSETSKVRFFGTLYLSLLYEDVHQTKTLTLFSENFKKV